MFDLIKKIGEVINLLNSCALDFNDCFGKVKDYFPKETLSDDTSGAPFATQRKIQTRPADYIVKTNISKRAGGGLSPSCPSNKTFSFERENEKILKVLKFFETPDKKVGKLKETSSDKTILNETTENKTLESFIEAAAKKGLAFKNKFDEYRNSDGITITLPNVFRGREKNPKEETKNEEKARKYENSDNNNPSFEVSEEEINAFGEKFSEILSRAIKNKGVADNY